LIERRREARKINKGEPVKFPNTSFTATENRLVHSARHGQRPAIFPKVPGRLFHDLVMDTSTGQPLPLSHQQ